jgi:hypothetical protein
VQCPLLRAFGVTAILLCFRILMLLELVLLQHAVFTYQSFTLPVLQCPEGKFCVAGTSVPAEVRFARFGLLLSVLLPNLDAIRTCIVASSSIHLPVFHHARFAVPGSKFLWCRHLGSRSG